jgi:hypothetical protein
MGQNNTCWVKLNYGFYADLAWLYAIYDLDEQKFVKPRISHERDGGWLYFNLEHGKQYLLFYYHRYAYIMVDREIEVYLVKVCCACEDKLESLGKMMIEFSSFEWLHEQRRKGRIPQQIMTFLSFVPYYAKPPEFTSLPQSRDEQEMILRMIRDNIVLKEW